MPSLKVSIPRASLRYFFLLFTHSLWVKDAMDFALTVLFFFLGLHSWHMEIPRLGVKSKLPLLAYTTATAKADPSRICDLHHSSWQRWILDPLSKVRDWTHILMDTSCILNLPSHNRNYWSPKSTDDKAEPWRVKDSCPSFHSQQDAVNPYSS